jgi:hypothetical protein
VIHMHAPTKSTPSFPALPLLALEEIRLGGLRELEGELVVRLAPLPDDPAAFPASRADTLLFQPQDTRGLAHTPDSRAPPIWGGYVVHSSSSPSPSLSPPADTRLARTGFDLFAALVLLFGLLSQESCT